MPTSITVTSELGGAERVFALPIGQLVELKEAVGVGPLRLLQQLEPVVHAALGGLNPHAGDFHPRAIREVLRLALIGGGMAPSESGVLIERYVDTEPLLTHLNLAYAVLAKSLMPDPGAKEGAEDTGKQEPIAT